jgi:hypothetical protein
LAQLAHVAVADIIGARCHAASAGLLVGHVVDVDADDSLFAGMIGYSPHLPARPLPLSSLETKLPTPRFSGPSAAAAAPRCRLSGTLLSANSPRRREINPSAIQRAAKTAVSA